MKEPIQGGLFRNVFRPVLVFASLFHSSLAFPFDYFEHRYIGNDAYKSAMANLRQSNMTLYQLIEDGEQKFPWSVQAGPQHQEAMDLLRKLPLEFGDLSAMAGDLAETPGDLLKALKEMGNGDYDGRHRILVTRRQWFNACSWLRDPQYDLPPMTQEANWDACFDEHPEDDKRLNNRYAASGYQPSRTEQAEFEGLPAYTSLASNNRNHFPRNSWEQYAKYHLEAIKYAKRMVNASGVSDKQEIIEGALLNEGFAQHFLQDSFSSGHIGTQYNESFFLHPPTKQRVQQTHDVLNRIGLRVVIPQPATAYVWSETDRGNSAQQDGVGSISPSAVEEGWTAFGDDNLFTDHANFHRRILHQVTTKSLSEVLQAMTDSSLQSKLCLPHSFAVPKDTSQISDLSKEAIESNAPITGDRDNGTINLVQFTSVLETFDLRSSDQRVPSLPYEGWKIGVELVNNAQLPPSTATDKGVGISLDYIRSEGGHWPNVFGFKDIAVPNVRTSYLFNVGWMYPAEVSPMSITGKLNVGLRKAENQLGQYALMTSNFVEFTPELQYTYAFYPPFSFKISYQPWDWLWSKHRNFHEYNPRTMQSISLGFQLDLAAF